MLSSCLVLTDSYATSPPDLTKPVVIVPEKIPGIETLSAEQVVEVILAKPDIIVIDARIREDRQYGYLDESISLPDIETNCHSLAEYIPNKNRPVIFYCNGIQCGRSVISIKVARSCGYSKLYWFKGGFAEWKQKGFPYVRY